MAEVGGHDNGEGKLKIKKQELDHETMKAILRGKSDIKERKAGREMMLIGSSLSTLLGPEIKK